MPTAENTCSDVGGCILQLLMHGLLQCEKTGRVRTYLRLGFEKRLHCLVITLLPVENRSQFIPSTNPSGPGVLAGVGKQRTDPFFRFLQPAGQPVEPSAN